MCGLCGFSLKKPESWDRLGSVLLQDIDSRGGDATGAAWWNAGKLRHFKVAEVAKPFIERMDIRKDLGLVQTFTGHTRFATQGHESDNKNNHPIVRKEQVETTVKRKKGPVTTSEEVTFLGMHNGVVYNYNLLAKCYELNAEVDSEALFAYTYDEWRDGPCLDEVQAAAAISVLRSDEPDTIYIARHSSSPMFVGLWNGGLVYSSFAHSLKELKLDDLTIWEMDEQTWIKVRHGRILQQGSTTTGVAAKDLKAWGKPVDESKIRFDPGYTRTFSYGGYDGSYAGEWGSGYGHSCKAPFEEECQYAYASCKMHEKEGTFQSRATCDTAYNYDPFDMGEGGAFDMGEDEDDTTRAMEVRVNSGTADDDDLAAYEEYWKANTVVLDELEKEVG